MGVSTDILKSSLSTYDSLIGIDLSETSLTEAINNNSDSKTSFQLMNCEKLLFEDNSFDLVCLSNSLHHLSLPEITLSEMKRVVKPNGHLIIFEMYSDNQNSAQMSSVKFHHFVAKLGRMYGRVHNDTYLKDDIISLLVDNNLDIIAEDNITFPYSEDFDYSSLIKKHMLNASNNLVDHIEYNSLMADGNDFLNHIKNHGISNESIYSALCRI